MSVIHTCESHVLHPEGQDVTNHFPICPVYLGPYLPSVYISCAKKYTTRCINTERYHGQSLP